MCKELGRLANGYKDQTDGTGTLHYMTHDEIRKIPRDRTVTYARIVVDIRPQKKDPNRVRITVGGNLIDYPFETTTRTTDMITNKLLWNSVLSTPDAKYCCGDLKNFYLETPMERREYMRIKVEDIPDEFMDEYNLHAKIYKGHIYCEIRRGMYGLPQAGIIANQQLKKRLAPHGYYEVKHTPGLWRHTWRPLTFTLVVDDFGIKYVGKEHAEHLFAALRKDYTLDTDWTGGLYCGITLKWDYKKRTLDTSMPGSIKKILFKFGHPPPNRPQHSPHAAPIPQYGAKQQVTPEPDDSPALSDTAQKRVQQIIGSLLFPARAVDSTLLTALSTIASQQAAPTENTTKAINHLLDYCHTHPDATICYFASEMILQIHSDSSYLTEPKARSRAGGHYFLGSTPRNDQPITLNGAIHTLCGIIKQVVSSAAESELATLFLNAKEGKIMRLTLDKMGHPQPPTPIHVDNTTAAGIANNTVKKQRSRAMDMRYFWIVDQVEQRQFDVQWHPGQENLGDYVTKHHPAAHHRRVRPYYVHEHNSPRTLPRAVRPSVMRGCADSSPGTYQARTPLPRVSTRHSAADS